MNKHELRQLIKSRLQHILESDGHPIQLDNDITVNGPVGGGRSDLMNLPGAPYGGNLYRAQLSILPNEARELLQNWAKLCKWSLKKYGEPSNWPAMVKQSALEAGKRFEERAGGISSPMDGPTSANLPL